MLVHMGKLLFTVPRSDLKLEFFRAGGKGGQKQNKTSSACRITHEPSGATGESRDERQQTQNRKLALERLVKNPQFVGWLKMETAAKLEGWESTARKVDEMLDERNLRVETAPDCVPGEAYCDLGHAGA